MDFEKFFEMKSSLFRGRAQNFSMFNLDLEMRIQYIEPLNSTLPFGFTLATNGNSMIDGAPVYPNSGVVQYEITDAQGLLKSFSYQGQSLQLKADPRVLYLVESDEGYQQRISALNAFKKNGHDDTGGTGRMIGVVHFSLFQQKIQFFQVKPETNQLVFRGVFDGLDDQRK